MGENLFGRIIDAGHVETAVRATLQKWLETFLTEVEDQNSLARGAIDRPWASSYHRTTDPRSLPTANLPAIAIEGTGPISQPQIEADQTVTVNYGVSVTVFAKGIDRDDALDNARRIGAAIRATLTSRAGCTLEGFADDVWWIDEDFAVLEASRERTMAGTEEVFGVRVDNTMTYGIGPDTPEPEPDPLDPYTSESVQIDLEPLDPPED